jgi:hypothetical protein
MLPEPATAMPLVDIEPVPRQCGRCRQMFEGDPALEPGTLPDWWLCPPCRLVLLPPVGP